MTHNFVNTNDFQLDTTDSFWNGLTAAQKTNVGNNATFLQGQAETAFATTTGWFGTDTTKFGTSHRQEVSFDLPDNNGASNNGYGSTIHIAAQANNSGSSAGPIVCMLWMAEWVEILMSLTSTWNAGDSSGEGLSHWCALQLFLSGHNSYYTSGNNQIFVQNWLNGDGSPNQGSTVPNSARSDWVNHTYTGSTVSGTFVHGDGDPVSYGCALAFIYYLTTQLGFTINEVIAKYNSNLASCYHGVTSDSTDPFVNFMALVNHVYPSDLERDSVRHEPEQHVPDRTGRVLCAEEHVRQGRGARHHHASGRPDLVGVLGRDRRDEQAGVPEPRRAGRAVHRRVRRPVRRHDHAESGRCRVPERRASESAAAHPHPLRHHVEQPRAPAFPGEWRLWSVGSERHPDRRRHDRQRVERDDGFRADRRRRSVLRQHRSGAEQPAVPQPGPARVPGRAGDQQRAVPRWPDVRDGQRRWRVQPTSRRYSLT